MKLRKKPGPRAAATSREDGRKRTERRAELLGIPVKPLKLTPGHTVADLVENMSEMSVQARNIGECAQVLSRMMRDPDRPTVFLGLAGPLIAAGLRTVLRDLIVEGLVDVVVSTGAIVYQDVYQARGHRHYRGSTEADDAALRDLKINRIYDTYVDENKFWETDLWCGGVADQLPAGRYSSRAFLEALGERLEDNESILFQARRLGVPVFSPALNDSSLGIGLTEHYHRHLKAGKEPILLDSIRDNYEIAQIVARSRKTAAIYVAGGVPKNYINDAVVMGYIFGVERPHSYAIQITTAVTQDGGLSGSTLAEATSWGKIARGPSHAMAWVEPSVSLPLLAGYAMGKGLGRGRPRLRFCWDGPVLRTLACDDRSR